MFTIWYDYDTTCEWWMYIYCDMMKTIWNMLWYEISDKLTCLWYDILWCNMLWDDMYMMKMIMSRSMECYDMICNLNDMIWLTLKRRTSMKYNLSVCMKDMISDMKNDMSCTER